MACSMNIGVRALEHLVNSVPSILVYKLAERVENVANVVSESQFMFNWIHLVFIFSLSGFFTIVFRLLGVKGWVDKVITLLGITDGIFIEFFSNNFCVVLWPILTNLHTELYTNGNLSLSALLSQKAESVNFMSVLGGWVGILLFVLGLAFTATSIWYVNRSKYTFWKAVFNCLMYSLLAIFLNFFIYLFTPLVFNSTPSYNIEVSSTKDLNTRSLGNIASPSTDVYGYWGFICGSVILVAVLATGTAILMPS